MYNIDLASTVWHIISALLIFIFGWFLTLKCSWFLQISQKLSTGLYFYHTMFCFVALSYVLKHGGDAVNYYYWGAEPLASFRPGTVAINYITSILHQLDLSILGMFLVFNFFGSIGLLFVYASLNTITGNSSLFLRRLVLVFLFLPSVSFWSSSLGKDAISFLAMGIALFSSLNFHKRILLMFIALVLMLLVRPHMAGIMIIAVVISTVLSRDISLIPRFVLGSIGLVTALIMIPFALEYAGVENDASNLESYIETRQGYNQEGGGGIDISSMSLPMQMFTYMFRPLPVEAHSITQLLASLDNMLLMYLCYLALKAKLTTKNLCLTGNRIFMWWYVFISWVILSMTTANLGIAVRQKWMFTPILIFLIISIIASAQEARRKSNSYD